MGKVVKEISRRLKDSYRILIEDRAGSSKSGTIPILPRFGIPLNRRKMGRGKESEV